uniref:Uncharacterized protein n=1 Tax=Utricularia reniformis TaxID=192314 RepID=A0A1Y0B0P7_9LAMI|nr:hypothetical protein AEK19_MT0696 [Utricularia reniformis]ART30944.1 hypothetical protein AEK19_MT0696 [Utricularia reniformis]
MIEFWIYSALLNWLKRGSQVININRDLTHPGSFPAG